MEEHRLILPTGRGWTTKPLEYAHQEGVIHRDVKPSNLMLDNAGNLFVTDFGLARIRAGDNLTQTGELIGTLRYMSPERVEDGVPVDHRAVIYGLAATLYEMVANRPVVEGDTGEQILRKSIESRPPSLSTIDRQVPRDFATVLHKALEKEPSDRYRTAAEFADDLQRVVDNRTIRARHVRGDERLFRWAKRNPLLSISLLTVMTLLAVLAVGGFLAASNADRANEQLLASNYASDILVANIAAESGSLLHAERILLKWMPEKNGGRTDDSTSTSRFSCHIYQRRVRAVGRLVELVFGCVGRSATAVFFTGSPHRWSYLRNICRVRTS